MRPIAIPTIARVMIASLLLAIPIRAQANLTVDLSIGISESPASAGFLGDVMMSYRAPFRGGRWLAGMTAAYEGILGPDICPRRCMTFKGIAAQVGLDRSVSFVSIGGSIGPGIYHFGNDTTATGIQGRLEVAIPASTRGALVFASRHTWWGDRAPARESTAFLIGLRSRGFFGR